MFRKVIDMSRKIAFLSILLLGLVHAAGADEVTLKSDHPTTYTVQRGDTLWDIAGRFLERPWQWPEIWESNPQIADPHKIYPGNIIALTFRDGKPVLGLADGAESGEMKGTRNVRLSPAIREIRHEEAITTIPLDAIQQFLSRPLVLTDDSLEDSPYILGSQEDHLAYGPGYRVYVGGMANATKNKYSIFRKSTVYRDPDSGRVLGYEAEHIGDAIVEKFGDPATLRIVNANKEILKGDRLVAQESDELPQFIPHEPGSEVDGRIISVLNGVSKVSQHQVVVLNRGNDDGLEPGHVLAIYKDGAVVRDRIAGVIDYRNRREANRTAEKEHPSAFGRAMYSVANDLKQIDHAMRDFVGTPVSGGRGPEVQLPDERSGELMVFRTFDNLSYGLVMNIQRAVTINDVVRNP